mmetsp:Transcript_55764/g.154355  ORF Transcript_55764/g.154355 Transcript_55764/m.154355 type:complete len:137 (-) Transcript_55764:445-855(-)
METKTERLSAMVEGDPSRPTVSWLWVALRTEDELKQLVAQTVWEGRRQGVLCDVQRDSFMGHTADLRRVLEAMQRYSSTDDESGASARAAAADVPDEPPVQAGAAPAPQAKAKAKARAKAKAKVKANVRPRQRQRP